MVAKSFSSQVFAAASFFRKAFQKARVLSLMKGSNFSEAVRGTKVMWVAPLSVRR